MEMERSTKKATTVRKRPKLTGQSDAPDAVEGRKHIDVQTEQFLEELTDRPVEVEVDTQTDAFMDQLPAPIFIPMKTGIDVETQIYEGDLFDFDAEVEPILDVLVGKTLEQSMMEVMEEEELANMRAHQEQFEQIRNTELAETQRLEEAEKRRTAEKQRRVEQEKERVRQEQEVTEKVAARTFAKGFLSQLQSQVVQNLSEAGFFYDPLEAEVTNTFLPWLMENMASKLDTLAIARALADDLIADASKRQQEKAQEFENCRRLVEEARIAAEMAAAEEAARIAAEASAEETPAEGEQDPEATEGEEPPPEDE